MLLVKKTLWIRFLLIILKPWEITLMSLTRVIFKCCFSFWMQSGTFVVRFQDRRCQSTVSICLHFQLKVCFLRYSFMFSKKNCLIALRLEPVIFHNNKRTYIASLYSSFIRMPVLMAQKACTTIYSLFYRCYLLSQHLREHLSFITFTVSRFLPSNL